MDTPSRNSAAPEAAVAIRPIQRDDLPRLQAFMDALSHESHHFRFMEALQDVSAERARYFVEVDFDVDMALIAIVCERDPDATIIGVARYFGNLDGHGCEFALAVADAWHHHGIGQRLMHQLLGQARLHGYHRIEGEVSSANHAMLELMHSMDFRVASVPGDPSMRRVSRELLAPVRSARNRPESAANPCSQAPDREC